ncbi:hypothetical protein LINGRAHAP2_LOCUS33406 [Linum grandiflorum]
MALRLAKIAKPSL